MPPEKSLVSIVIPVYNREKYIGQALESVFDQTYRPIEVIVVDDGSTDNTAEITRSFKEVRYFHQMNSGKGAAMARNLGIQYSSGEYISILDSDDIWLPDKLTIQIEVLLNNPEVGYVLCRVKNFVEPGIPRPDWFIPEVADSELGSYISSTLTAKRSSFDQIGLFNPAFIIGEDTDWFIRARETNIPMAILPEILVRRRVHESNLCYMMNDRSWHKSNVLRLTKASIDRKKKTTAVP